MHPVCPCDAPVSGLEVPGIRHAIMHDMLLGRIEPAQVLPDTLKGPFRVLLLRPGTPGQVPNAAQFAERLHITGHGEHLSELICVGNDLALVLYGQGAMGKFEELSRHWDREDSLLRRILRFPEPMVLACGPIVGHADDIPQSYRGALALLEQSFFCGPEQLLLSPVEMPSRDTRGPVINILLLDKYAQALMQSIQAYNRTLTYATLAELESLLASGSDSPQAVRLFFADLYLQIKEQMRYLYQGYNIPFYTNTHIIKTILEAPSLGDITCFLAQRFDMIMSYIGASSQESVLGSVLHYIQHNYTSNITLESIAPLFGYNHSYLGKIFRKKMGVSFNEYIDRLRIEQAKTLLLQDNTKVYTISKQVGYKNVDYFHVKFRKYVNMSPVEFRRANQAP